MPNHFKTLAVALLPLMLSSCNITSKNEDSLKLYALDCGTLQIDDLAAFADDGRYNGQSITLANPCFLIRHPKGDLIWDTGYQQTLAQESKPVTFYQHFHKSMRTTLTAQLDQLGLNPQDIEYLSLSHAHDDHAGNANLFASATFIINAAERKQMFPAQHDGKTNAENGDLAFYDKLETAKTIQYEQQYDIFSDKSVIIHAMPGHTPGSSVLQINLSHAGTVLLTGDLYTHAQARTLATVPVFVDKPTILASRTQFEALAKQTNARVIIQHAKTDFDALPIFPGYLD